MKLFNTPGADAAYDRWQEPPNLKDYDHKKDGCPECHEYYEHCFEVDMNEPCWECHSFHKEQLDTCKLCEVGAPLVRPEAK